MLYKYRSVLCGLVVFTQIEVVHSQMTCADHSDCTGDTYCDTNRECYSCSFIRSGHLCDAFDLPLQEHCGYRMRGVCSLLSRGAPTSILDLGRATSNNCLWQKLPVCLIVIIIEAALNYYATFALVALFVSCAAVMHYCGKALADDEGDEQGVDSLERDSTAETATLDSANQHELLEITKNLCGDSGLLNCALIIATHSVSLDALADDDAFAGPGRGCAYLPECCVALWCMPCQFGVTRRRAGLGPCWNGTLILLAICTFFLLIMIATTLIGRSIYWPSIKNISPWNCDVAWSGRNYTRDFIPLIYDVSRAEKLRAEYHNDFKACVLAHEEKIAKYQALTIFLRWASTVQCAVVLYLVSPTVLYVVCTLKCSNLHRCRCLRRTAASFKLSSDNGLIRSVATSCSNTFAVHAPRSRKREQSRRATS